MNRRAFIAALGSAAAWPLAADAEQPLPVIGYLSSKDEKAEGGIIANVRIGLADQGFREGTNIKIIYRWSEGGYDVLPRLARDLVSSKVDVIAASGLPASLAAKEATSQIPIVFRLAVDPTAFGLAQGFDRPGDNLTGVTMLFDPLTAKKMQLLHELIPNAALGLLVNPKNPNNISHQNYAKSAAESLGLPLTVLTASNRAEIGPVFDHARQVAVGAILIGDDPLFDVESKSLVNAAAQHHIPTMYYVRDFTVVGGLISYGPSFEEMARQVGVYLGRILKGERPAELPVQQPTRFELVINLRTAKALGLNIPPNVLARADEVIE